MTHRLFVYGTLMFPEIRSVLVNRDFRTFPAVLEGYRRQAVVLSGRVAVPAIVEDEASSVAGLVMGNVDRKSLSVFDIFEGVKDGIYCREHVTVEDGEGRTLGVSTYVPGPAVREMLRGEWDPHLFRKRHLAAYRRRISAAWRAAK